VGGSRTAWHCFREHARAKQSQRKRQKWSAQEDELLRRAVLIFGGKRSSSMGIVVGNPTVLADDPDWREMVRFCAERDAIRGCGFHSADLGIDCAATLPPSEYAAAVHRTLELAGVGKLSKRMWPMFETKEADKQLGTDSVTDVDGVIDEDDDDTLTALHPRSLAALLASFGSSTTDDDEQSFHHELYGGEIDDCELQEFYSSELRWSVKL
jgi:hypothetical protein